MCGERRVSFPNYPKLWYGETPRILTAEELVAFVKDDIGFHAALKQLVHRPSKHLDPTTD